MRRITYYKRLFLMAGIWNLGAGFICWFGANFFREFFFDVFDMVLPPSLFAFNALFWIVIALGVGFYIVSRDIAYNHGLVFTGMLGKTFFFIICVVTLVLKEANFLIILVGAVDLIFAFLFLEFLRSYPNLARKE